MNTRIHPLNKYLLATALVCMTSFTGCSSTGSGQGAEEGEGTFSDQDLALQEKQRWADGNIPMATDGSGLFDDIHFEYDSAAITSENQEKIRENAQALVKDRALSIELEGHCDRRGTNEYNLALGEERARAVARLMVNYGVEGKQIKTISYGEEIPLDPSDSDGAFAKNRRVHFAPYHMSSNDGSQSNVR